jgi:hypothetical protein
MKHFNLLFALLFLIGFAQAQIEIDGDMLDWASVPAADAGEAAEELGDMTKGADYDLKDLYITNDDSMLYMRFAIDPNGSLTTGYTNGLAFSVYLETDLAGASGLDWGWWTMSLDYLIDISEAANFASQATILNNVPRSSAPVWPDDWDSVGVALVAINANANEVEMAIRLEDVDIHTNFRPFIEIVGAWDWGNPDGMPNSEYGFDPAYVVDYSFLDKMASVVQVRGPQIDSPIEIDGDLLDWASFNPVDVDQIAEELGDMSTGPEFDVQDFLITSDSFNVYIGIAINPAATFTGQWNNYAEAPVCELHFDTYLNREMGLGWGGFWIQAGDYKINLHDVYNPTTPVAEPIIWHFIGTWDGAVEEYDSVGTAVAAVNSSDNLIEIAVPRVIIHAGINIRPFVYSVGNQDWNVEEYFPNDQTNETGPSYVLNYNFISGASIFKAVAEPTSVDNPLKVDVPITFNLEQNYPNPFNPSTRINFSLPVTDRVTLVIYDLLGRKVKTLIDNQLLTASMHTVIWNAADDTDQKIGSGIYFYQLSSSKFNDTKKMIFVK